MGAIFGDVLSTGSCFLISVEGSRKRVTDLIWREPRPSTSCQDQGLLRGGKGQQDLSVLATSMWEKFLDVFSIGGCIQKSPVSSRHCTAVP